MDVLTWDRYQSLKPIDKVLLDACILHVFMLCCECAISCIIKTLIRLHAAISLDRRWRYCQCRVLFPVFKLNIHSCKGEDRYRKKIAITQQDFSWSLLPPTSEDLRMQGSCSVGSSWAFCLRCLPWQPSENLHGENGCSSISNRFMWWATSRKVKFSVGIRGRHQ